MQNEYHFSLIKNQYDCILCINRAATVITHKTFISYKKNTTLVDDFNKARLRANMQSNEILYK